MRRELNLVKKPLWLTGLVLLAVLTMSGKASAGNGTFTTTDGK